jgi:glucose-1-phosphate thymidylyltransferase
MTFSFLSGWWTDAGTFDSLLRAANLVAASAEKKMTPDSGAVLV